MSEYVPKVGDRVKVTIEGEVTAKGRQWFDIGDHTVATDTTPATVEKLADPEPEWVNGDLIRAGGGIFVYTRSAWRHTNSDSLEHRNLISNCWTAGGVEILYKADQQKEVA